MVLPPFEDFLASLSSEKLEAMAPKESRIVTVDTDSWENTAALINQAMNDAVVASAIYAHNLLQVYHEWLQERL